MKGAVSGVHYSGPLTTEMGARPRRKAGQQGE